MMNRYGQTWDYFTGEIPATQFYDLLEQCERAKLEERMELAQMVGLAQSGEFDRFKRSTLDDLYPWRADDRQAQKAENRKVTAQSMDEMNDKLNAMFSKGFKKEGGAN